MVEGKDDGIVRMEELAWDKRWTEFETERPQIKDG